MKGLIQVQECYNSRVNIVSYLQEVDRKEERKRIMRAGQGGK
jgi:hypothetical protein